MPRYFFCSLIGTRKCVICGSDDLEDLMRHVADWVAEGQYPHGVVERVVTPLLTW